MDKHEFRDWFAFHQSCFPGLIGWLDRATKPEGAPTRSDILGRWNATLRDVPLDAAKSASQKIAGGDEPEPKGYERHPSAVRAIALRSVGQVGGGREKPWERERIIDGVRIFRCPTCRDTGQRTCWHPTSMEAAERGTLGEPGTLYRCVVACTCQAGQYWARQINVPTFDPRRWCPLDRIDENGMHVMGYVDEPIEQDRLREFMAGMHKPESQQSYEPAFAEFSGPTVNDEPAYRQADFLEPIGRMPE